MQLNIVKSSFYSFVFIYSQASDGWTYFFKNHFNIVDRFARMGRGEKTPDEEKKLRNSIKKFKLEQFPTILAYLPNKVVRQTMQMTNYDFRKLKEKKMIIFFSDLECRPKGVAVGITTRSSIGRQRTEKRASRSALR